MKIACEMIKDLLPLYHDDVCSVESRLAVEKHLAECKNCNAELEAMKVDISLSTQSANMKESQVIHKISKKWRKDILKSSLKSALITALIIAIIGLILFIFIDVDVYRP